MTTVTNADVSVTTDWVDLVATYSGMAGALSWVQNKSPADVLVVFSASGSAPTGSTGFLLTRGAQTTGSAAHVWVKGVGDDAVVGSGVV